jgi:hypothetical protein
MILEIFIIGLSTVTPCNLTRAYAACAKRLSKTFDLPMAELGAAIGVGAVLGGAVYTAATGFAARHETTHSLLVTEIRRLVTDFEAAYRRGDVTEDDWQRYQAIRDESVLIVAYYP